MCGCVYIAAEVMQAGKLWTHRLVRTGLRLWKLTAKPNSFDSTSFSNPSKRRRHKQISEFWPLSFYSVIFISILHQNIHIWKSTWTITAVKHTFWYHAVAIITLKTRGINNTIIRTRNCPYMQYTSRWGFCPVRWRRELPYLSW